MVVVSQWSRSRWNGCRYPRIQFNTNGNTQKTGHCVGAVAGGDGIASAGVTSGESIKRKNGGISDSEMLYLFPKPEHLTNTLFKDDE